MSLTLLHLILYNNYLSNHEFQCTFTVILYSVSSLINRKVIVCVTCYSIVDMFSVMLCSVSDLDIHV